MLFGADTKELFPLKTLDGAGKEKAPLIHYARPGWHGKAFFTVNARPGWYKKRFLTQYLRLGWHEKALFTENARRY